MPLIPYFCTMNRKYMSRLFCVVTVTLALALIVTSCGSSRGVVANRIGGRGTAHGGHTSMTDKKSSGVITTDRTMDEPTKRLLEEARSWLGVPYQWGGNDKAGVDCSGFVVGVYKSALRISLPRNSAKQSEYVTIVSPDKLSPGDLVFFDTSRDRAGKVTHVGMYIGNGEMVHSSSSRGVIVSCISRDYYAERLISCGRVEQYHAMLDKKRDIEKKSEKPKEEEREKALSDPDLLARNDIRHAKDKRMAKTRRNTRRESAQTEPKTQLERDRTAVTAENVRKSVLNSLIEEKIDSIYAAPSHD